MQLCSTPSPFAMLAVVAALAAGASAQCLAPATGTTVALTATLPPLAANDEGRSAPLALGFAFPITGASSPSFTHAVVDANGALYLTNGGPAVGPADFGPQNGVDDLRGLAGDSPRVFPLWADYEGIAPTWSIRADASVPGRFRVTWTDVELVGSGGPSYSFAATLFASGSVELDYGSLPNDAFGYAGISCGNGVGTGFESGDDLVGGASSGSLGLLFGDYLGLSTPPVTIRRVTLTPNGTGGFDAIQTCAGAEHVPYGDGCYTYEEANQAVYQLFPNVAASLAALPGTSIQFSIVGLDSYAVTNGGGTYIPPSPTATILTLSDDSSVTYVPSIPFPHANGTAYTQLSICSNGFVSMAPAGVNPNGTGGSVSQLLSAPAPSFRSQRDYNPSVAASGKVKREEITLGGERILLVTWDGVFIYNSTAPERFQIQLNLTTGQVTMVWVDMAAATPQTRALLVGCSPGPSFNPGGISLATGLPVLTAPDVELRPLTLSANPPAVVNPSTNVTYTIDNVPELVPGSGVHVATLFLSLGALPGGVDLGLIGAPGCSAYIASLDVNLAVAPSLTTTASVLIPINGSAIPAGINLYFQAVALFDPNFPLPNGQNPFGLLTSNGLRTFVQSF